MGAMDDDHVRDGPTVSVVICAYTERRLDALRRAIPSAAAQSRPPLERIVVSDHNPALPAAFFFLMKLTLLIASWLSTTRATAASSGPKPPV